MAGGGGRTRVVLYRYVMRVASKLSVPQLFSAGHAVDVNAVAVVAAVVQGRKAIMATSIKT